VASDPASTVTFHLPFITSSSLLHREPQNRGQLGLVLIEGEKISSPSVSAEAR
jgi:hypothetical protein